MTVLEKKGLLCSTENFLSDRFHEKWKANDAVLMPERRMYSRLLNTRKKRGIFVAKNQKTNKNTYCTMNCIILDDDQLAQNAIADFIEHVPYLNLIGKCTTAFEAYDELHKNKIDLIFLDTQLPGISGIDFIKSLDEKPMIIFTTLFQEFALEAFNLNAMDYLMKPISFDRFLKATNKAYEYYSLKNLKMKVTGKAKEPSAASDFILVKADYKTIKVNLDDILYVEGLKDYIKIFTVGSEKPIITLNSLKRMQENLPSERFARVHKSFIISLNHIKVINKTQVVIGKTYIPIGESYKDIFISEMENKRLMV